MQNPIPSFAGFRHGASRAMRFIVVGTGIVLTGTGTVLVCSGLALKACGQKLKSFTAPGKCVRPQPRPVRRARRVPQPA